jgi:hypothetical protein
LLIFGIIFIIVSLFLLFKPHLLWEITQSWKFEGEAEPSQLFILSTRIGGVIVLAVGLFGVIVSIAVMFH